MRDPAARPWYERPCMSVHRSGAGRGRPALTWSLVLSGLVGCTSFANVDDVSSSGSSGSPASGSSVGTGGAGGMRAPAPIGFGWAGSAASGPTDGASASEVGGVCAGCDAGSRPGCADGAACDAGSSPSCADAGGCVAGPTPSCTDGIRDQDETRIDCGGSCRPCPTTCTSVVADSVTDFSGTQGQASWFYGYYEEPSFLSSSFLQFSDFHLEQSLADEGWFSSTAAWTWIGRLRMHPNGRVTTAPAPAIEQHAVRRWISPVSETLLLQGLLRPTSSGSSGVRGSIRVGDDEVWQQVTAPGLTDALAVQLLVEVHVGDALNIVLDPYLFSDVADDTEFSVRLCR